MGALAFTFFGCTQERGVKLKILRVLVRGIFSHRTLSSAPTDFSPNLITGQVWSSGVNRFRPQFLKW